MKVAVEIGGTFTDLVWLDGDGRASTGKAPSRPDQIHEAVLDVLGQAGLQMAEAEQFSHGSTVATNALLTRRGAATGILTTEGFRDVVEIGTHDRPGDIYSAFYRKARLPIRRAMVREVRERLDAAGEVITPLDETQAWVEVERLLAAGAESIAIVLLHAYRNPAHERRLVELIRDRASGVNVFASHEVSPEFREYERTVTTAVNAFVGPVVSGYVDELRRGLAKRGYAGSLRLMQSNGGIMPAQAARSNAVRMLLSGPAAGVRAAVWFAGRNAIRNILTLDMGGTSTDVAVAPDLEPRIVPELQIDGLPIRTTSMDMATVGAGGGSIATVDTGGLLNVGPASAGAVPGPACYGRGGSLPTVTDAQVVSGILRPKRFFGGKMELKRDLAEAALASLGFENTAAAADAVLRMVNSNMASAVRLVSTQRGIDPRHYALVAYGGGGPVHGAMVAEEVGIRSVLVPWSPGISSAFGLLVADLIVDVVQGQVEPLADTSLDADRVSEIEAACETAAADLGLSPGTYEIRLGLDLRYAGQGYELTIWCGGEPAGADVLRARFAELHVLRYGWARESLPVQVVNARARIIQKNEALIDTPVAPGDGTRERAEIMLQGNRIEATCLSRGTLTPGEILDGPAIIEEATSTTLVPPGWRAKILASFDLLLEKVD